jgi:hypothetical protein
MKGDVYGAFGYVLKLLAISSVPKIDLRLICHDGKYVGGKKNGTAIEILKLEQVHLFAQVLQIFLGKEHLAKRLAALHPRQDNLLQKEQFFRGLQNLF